MPLNRLEVGKGGVSLIAFHVIQHREVIKGQILQNIITSPVQSSLVCPPAPEAWNSFPELGWGGVGGRGGIMELYLLVQVDLFDIK